MKKVLLLLVAVSFASISFGQVFSTGQTLKSGAMSLGIEPAVVGNNFGIFFHGGYGLNTGSDLGIKAGFGQGNPYIEGNVEFGLLRSNPYLSATLGGHYNGNFGFDGGATITFPVSRVFLSSGLDMNLDFYQADTNADGKKELHTSLPVWLPFGLEVYVKKHLSIIFEAEVGVSSAAYTIVGGGISMYF